MHLTPEQVNLFAEGQLEMFSDKGHRRGGIERISIAASAPIMYIYLYWEAEERDGEWYAIKSEHITHEHRYEFDLEPFEEADKGDDTQLSCRKGDFRIILHAPHGDMIDPACVHGVSPA